MPIGTAYQFIKDLISFARMKEIDPVEVATLDATELANNGLIKDENLDAYSWAAPRNLFARTGGPDPSHEVVWVTDKLRRTKQKVVRFTHDGNHDLILIRKKGANI